MTKMRLNKILLIASVILLLLLLSFTVTLILQGEGYRWRGRRDATLRDYAHQLGWIGTSLFVTSNLYSLLKRISPRNVKTWLPIHCMLGIASLIFVCLHVIGGLWPIRPGGFLSLFGFLLMIVVITSGVLGKFVKIEFVKNYWRVLHVPLTIMLYLVLAVHVLDKLALP
ncbi:MAG: hypothetical protein QXM73_03050 [Candidatus Nezhaarchaeales archaeon]